MQKQKIIFSLVFKFLERILVKGLGLIISVLLARLLNPKEFGLIAIIMVFIDLSQTLIQSGLNTALVQSKTTKEEDYSTVFYIGLIISITLIIILYISSPLIGAFYESKELVWPLRVYSFSLIFAAINSVQVAKMQKEMKFRESMFCSLIATILSGCIGIGMAYCDMGIWSLVMYYFSNIIFSCITMAPITKWRLQKVFSVKRAKELFDYGWKMLVSAVLCSLYNNIRSLIIGKQFSTEELGYYNRGQQFPDVIANTLDNSIQSVMFPVLSDIQDEKKQTRMMLQKSITMGSFLVMPTMIGFAAISDSFIRVLLTDKWLPSALYLQIICIGNMTLSITSSNLVAIKAIGRSDIYMKLEGVRRCVMLLILCLSIFCFRTVEAIAWGFAISSWIDTLIVMLPAKRLFAYGGLEQLRDLSKIFLASFIMGALVLSAGKVETVEIIKLILQIAIGIISYFIICKILKVNSLIYIVKNVKQLKTKRDYSKIIRN